MCAKYVDCLAISAAGLERVRFEVSPTFVGVSSMEHLRSGQYCGIADTSLTVTCSWRRSLAVDADLSAILLDGGRRVREDADFVFTTSHPQSTMRFSTSGSGRSMIASRTESALTCHA